MPAERIDMRGAREIIRLKSSCVSTHEIARQLGLARSTVWETLKRAENAGLAWPLPEDMNDAVLDACALARDARRPNRAPRCAGDPACCASLC
jgi:IS30 family transposase